MSTAEPDHEGSHGRAWRLAIPDDSGNWQYAATVCHYLITAPAYHPLWSQYVLAVIRLGKMDGVPDAHLQFPGATHELMVVAMAPDTGHGGPDGCQQHTPECMNGEHPRNRDLSFLQPGNVAWQTVAADEEMEQLADMAVQAVVSGIWNPETAGSPDAIREAWNAGLIRTLAHIRGEVHAPGDGEPVITP